MTSTHPPTHTHRLSGCRLTLLLQERKFIAGTSRDLQAGGVGVSSPPEAKISFLHAGARIPSGTARSCAPIAMSLHLPCHCARRTETVGRGASSFAVSRSTHPSARRRHRVRAPLRAQRAGALSSHARSVRARHGGRRSTRAGTEEEMHAKKSRIMSGRCILSHLAKKCTCKLASDEEEDR